MGNKREQREWRSAGLSDETFPVVSVRGGGSAGLSDEGAKSDLSDEAFPVVNVSRTN
jgi:hypothetical protein